MLKSAVLQGLLGLAVLGAACSSPAADVCARIEECSTAEGNPNNPGQSDEEAIAICAVNIQGVIDMIKANEEAECKDYAAATEDIYRCIAAQECDDTPETNDERCKAEQDRAEDICDRIAAGKIDCEVSFGFVCREDTTVIVDEDA